jgi:hypothetical protein
MREGYLLNSKILPYLPLGAYVGHISVKVSDAAWDLTDSKIFKNRKMLYIYDS